MLVSHGIGGTAGVAASHARAIQRSMPHRAVTAACLFGEPSLERALDVLDGEVCEVLPLLMAEGRTMTTLRRRLADYPRARLALPLGRLPGLDALILAKAEESCDVRGWLAAETRLLLAAHGSSRDPASAKAARDRARACKALDRFRDVSVGFLDQPPRLGASLHRTPGQACLVVGLFVDEGPHGRDDVMQALRQAGDRIAYAGAVGADERVASLIVGAVWEPGRHAA